MKQDERKKEFEAWRKAQDKKTKDAREAHQRKMAEFERQERETAARREQSRKQDEADRKAFEEQMKQLRDQRARKQKEWAANNAKMVQACLAMAVDKFNDMLVDRQFREISAPFSDEMSSVRSSYGLLLNWIENYANRGKDPDHSGVKKMSSTLLADMEAFGMTIAALQETLQTAPFPSEYSVWRDLVIQRLGSVSAQRGLLKLLVERIQTAKVETAIDTKPIKNARDALVDSINQFTYSNARKNE